MATTGSRSGMGAVSSNGGCTFRVWAPTARRVRVVGDFTNPPWLAGAVDLQSENNEYWSADVPNVPADSSYKFVIDNDQRGPGADPVWRVDPHARDVENSGADANGIVCPLPAGAGKGFVTPRFENFLVYQLHVGSFVGFNDPLSPLPAGRRVATFREVIPKLPYVRDLGFNAIALLPIGEFSGDVGMGYAPSNYFAPESAYGAPDDLRALVDAAHANGLAVLFDVVFNHASTSDNRLWEFDGMTADGGIYFEHGGDTPFGRAPAHWKVDVRNFFLDNGRMWFREYGGDGIRFDAAHFIADDSIRHVVHGLRNDFPDKYLVAEYAKVSPDPIRDLGFHAIWGMSDPDRLRHALNGVNPLDNLRAFIGPQGLDQSWNWVRYLTGSHDQICDNSDRRDHFDQRYLVETLGGRDNWHARAKARLAWALNATAPGTPMMFMGTEGHHWGYWHPDDRAGEHRLDWGLIGDPTGAPMQRMVRDVNNTRWNHPALRAEGFAYAHLDYDHGVLAFRRWNDDGDVVLVIVNCSDNQWDHLDYGVQTGAESGQWEEVFNSQSPQYGGWDGSGNFGHRPWVQADGRIYINLPKWSVLVFRKL
jgi:1,4-alpha-glucan branching enzyme